MEKAPSQNIQDAFLNTARRERMTVVIHLLHGATLSGRIKSFDKFSVLLDVGGQDFLIFKHAISTISQEQRKRSDFAPAPQQQTHSSSTTTPSTTTSTAATE
ncbi:MAG: RNA chaperone Hfq [Acidobacteriota bacterium]|nr:RNA chaperone Hfq [Acidobacteriota bacterium]